MAIREFILRAAAAAALGGCASTPQPAPSGRAGHFGLLDPVYDRNEWRWVTNPDGRELLENTRISKCFVDPKPDLDFNDPGFALKREQKTIGGTSYAVLNVYSGRDLWIATYQRNGVREPLLGVYAEGRCREAAESLLRAYETKKGPA